MPGNVAPVQLELRDVQKTEQRAAAGRVASGLGELHRGVGQLGLAPQLHAAEARGAAPVAQQLAKLLPLRGRDRSARRFGGKERAAGAQEPCQLFEPLQMLRPRRLKSAVGLRRQRMKLGEQGLRLQMQGLLAARRSR